MLRNDTARSGKSGRIIETEGPMTVSDYMQLCLAHPRHGYYVTRDPLGRGGDFVTAPEVSQMFGELIGAWAAAVWQQMGSPAQGASRRARAGPRHLDGGRAARRDRNAGFSFCCFGSSGRDEPGLVRPSGENTREHRGPNCMASRRRRAARRAGDRDRERVRRRAAGRPVHQGSRWLARSHDRHRRRQAGFHGGARCAVRACRGAERRRARYWNGARTSRSRCCRAASRQMAARR